MKPPLGNKLATKQQSESHITDENLNNTIFRCSSQPMRVTGKRRIPPAQMHLGKAGCIYFENYKRLQYKSIKQNQFFKSDSYVSKF